MSDGRCFSCTGGRRRATAAGRPRPKAAGDRLRSVTPVRTRYVIRLPNGKFTTEPIGDLLQAQREANRLKGRIHPVE